MRVCFVHQNMPAQYRHLIAGLLERGDEVVAIGEASAVKRWSQRHPRLTILAYNMPPHDKRPPAPAHLTEFDDQVMRGQMVARALRVMLGKGLSPDLVCVHPGWGEGLFVRAELPETPLLAYCEFFYRLQGSDVGFDPEYPSSEAAKHRLQLRKLPHLLMLDDANAGVCPTEWQRAQFPDALQPKLKVAHDGVDTELLTPLSDASLTLGDWTLRAGEPIVTYVARNLEPYRGFHTFMRCLPELQRRAPDARVVIVGGDEVSYGARLPPGQSYRARLLAELGDRIDMGRVRFTGKLPYTTYVQLLRVSAAHAYLTYPFVLSWSLLEAMSCGCAIVASRTPPVEEVISDGVNGWLTDFFDPQALAEKLAGLLAGRPEGAAVRTAARRTIVERFDLKRICRPAGIALLDAVAAQRC